MMKHCIDFRHDTIQQQSTGRTGQPRLERAQLSSDIAKNRQQSGHRT